MKESLSDNQRVYHPVENYDQLKEKNAPLPMLVTLEGIT